MNAITKLLLGLLVAATVSSRSWIAQAQFSGQFDLRLSAIPAQTAYESVEFSFDVETRLQATFSVTNFDAGVTLGWLGVAGFEEFAFHVSATLGTISIADRFVFAAPFSLDAKAILLDLPVALSQRVGDVRFLKKMVDVGVPVPGGLTLKTAIVIEDLALDRYFKCQRGIGMDFDPLTPGIQDDEDPANPGINSDEDFISCPDLPSDMDPLPQKIRFGSAFIIEGETVGGVDVTGVITMGLDNIDNRTKKTDWGPYSVIDNRKIEFVKETLAIEDIAFGPLTLSHFAEFRMQDSEFWIDTDGDNAPDGPLGVAGLYYTPHAVVTLLDLGNLSVTATTQDILTGFTFDSVKLSVAAKNVSGQIKTDVSTGELHFSQLAISVSLGMLSFSASKDFPGSLSLSTTLATKPFSLTASAAFSSAGALDAIGFSTGVTLGEVALALDVFFVTESVVLGSSTLSFTLSF